MEKELSYEEAVKELDAIVMQIESGAVSMSQSMQLFERGADLIKLCYAHLDKAKGKLFEIKESIDGLQEI